MRLFLKKALPLILAVLICITATVSFAEQPKQKEMTVEVEGMSETVLMTRHTIDGRLAIWYDVDHFFPEAIENGVRFLLLNNQLESEVSFTVKSLNDPANVVEPMLEVFVAEYAAQGWDCEKVDTTGILPLFNTPERPVRGFIARQEREAALVYLSYISGGYCLSTLRFPNEAAEGWGNRMLFMINTLESVVGN